MNNFSGFVTLDDIPGSKKLPEVPRINMILALLYGRPGVQGAVLQ